MDENKSLEELAKEQRREYQRKWRANNKDKVRKHANDYWMRRAMKLLQEEQHQ